MKVHFSSERQDWETPQPLFDMLNDEFYFTLDAAADHRNAKCDEYFTPQDDALSCHWHGRVWLNPPYGRSIGRWMRHCYEQSRRNADVVVALVPARTDTEWWHEHVMRAAEVRLVRGRLRFGGAKNSAPFPSAVAIWHPWSEGPPVLKAMDRYRRVKAS